MNYAETFGLPSLDQEIARLKALWSPWQSGYIAPQNGYIAPQNGDFPSPCPWSYSCPRRYDTSYEKLYYQIVAQLTVLAASHQTLSDKLKELERENKTNQETKMNETPSRKDVFYVIFRLMMAYGIPEDLCFRAKQVLNEIDDDYWRRSFMMHATAVADRMEEKLNGGQAWCLKPQGICEAAPAQPSSRRTSYIKFPFLRLLRIVRKGGGNFLQFGKKHLSRDYLSCSSASFAG